MKPTVFLGYRFSNGKEGKWYSLDKPNNNYYSKNGSVGGSTLYERVIVLSHPYTFYVDGRSPSYPIKLYTTLFSARDYPYDFFERRREYENQMELYLKDKGYDGVIFRNKQYTESDEVWIFTNTVYE